MFNVKRRRQVQQLWHHQPSGVVIPAGTHTDLSTSCSETLLEIKEKALAVECLYRENKIKIPQNCDLSRLIGDSKAVSDAWFMDTLALVPIERQLNILHLNRVADAILPLARREGVARYLVPLTSGTLNLFDRTKSPAKDILWELELWSILKKSSLDVRFGEPDLLITLNDSILSVACKKLYSDRHLQNVLSQAVRQIEARGECGIVAINLDDLLPPNKILQMPSDQSTQEFVTQLNNLFFCSGTSDTFANILLLDECFPCWCQPPSWLTSPLHSRDCTMSGAPVSGRFKVFQLIRTGCSEISISN